ncbi:MAG: hypothetical protein HN465_04930 [Nitrospina sp.]|jgi:hypothetical protein|nr:hypothetical protein [Nitrospina sp.]
MKQKEFINKSNLAIFILLWATLFLMNPVSGSGEEFEKENSFGKTKKARLAVEEAWDVYHDGALGGTLQSPKVQTKLEMDLHKSRGLLAEAYDAADGGDLTKANEIIQKIMKITHGVIAESKVRKK